MRPRAAKGGLKPMKATNKELLCLEKLRTGFWSVFETGEVWSKRGNRQIGSLTPQGYATVNFIFGGRHMWVFVHRLVWVWFRGPIPEHLTINHRNGIKHDNRLGNLELVTPRENTWHAIKVLGQSRAGERNCRAKLTWEDVLDIKRRLKHGETCRDIGKAFGVTDVAIGFIKRGQHWISPTP
jgi:hypothetical protein